jgi:hypothetical protein
MKPLPRYNEKGELDTRLRVDPVTGDVGIGTPKLETKDEPVAWMYDWTTSEGEFIQDWTTSEAETLRDTEPTIITNVRPLYTTPQRTWVGLTEEDLKPICDEWRIVYGAWVHDFAKEIETKLKEKNHGNS